MPDSDMCPSPNIIRCVPGDEDTVVTGVRTALAELDAGGSPDPLFFVGPHVDLAEIRSEITSCAIPDGTGVLMRTSGSTAGTGKIVALSWESLLASATATDEAMGGPGVWASQLATHHIAGFQTIVRSLRAGFEPLFVNFADEPGLADQLQSARRIAERVYVSVVPTQLTRILASPTLTDAFRDVVLLVGGAALSSDLAQRAETAGLRLVRSYGMTETGGGCVYDGKAIGDTEVLLDDDGRITLRGSVVALGYANVPDSDEFSIVSGMRSHHTRDVGTFTDGILTVVGRIDDAITTGGLTVMPRLIEDAVSSITGVDCVVVGVPHATWGEAAVAVLAAPSSSTETDIRNSVRERLGKGWQPRRVITLAELGLEQWPMTQSGKISRRELAAVTRVYFQPWQVSTIG